MDSRVKLYLERAGNELRLAKAMFNLSKREKTKIELEANPSRCWYSDDSGVTNYSSVSCGTNWTGLTGNSSLGSNTWTIYINDSAGNENSTVLTFTVDNVAPNITYDATTESGGANLSRDNIFVNVSAADVLGNVSTFIDFDGSLVGWWRMDDVNSTGDPWDRSAYCYDNETRVMTATGWKYFRDVNYEDEIATLNETSGEVEYHKPFEIQDFVYSGDMYRIKTLEGDLLVSPEHNVYFKKVVEDKEVSLMNKIKRLKDEMIKLFIVGLNYLLGWR